MINSHVNLGSQGSAAPSNVIIAGNVVITPNPVYGNLPVFSGTDALPLLNYRIDGVNMSEAEFKQWLKKHDEVQAELVRGSMKAGVNTDI